MNTMEIRYHRLHQAMQERELDAVYVNAPENHLYMSHFDNPDGYLLISADESFVFADFRYTEAAKENVFPCCIVKEPGKPVLSELVAEKGWRRIGYEDESLTCAALAGLQKKMPEVEFVPTGDMFAQIRCAKTEDEIENIVAAQQAAIEAARPGMRNAELDKVARDIIDAAGYGACFGHSLGHGVGLLIHEEPRVSSGAGERVLHPGEVITIEPGIYLEGKYGCRIEDMLYITADGKRNLTECPKELIEV